MTLRISADPYAKPVGDCFVDKEVIAKPDLYDAVYALLMTGALDRLIREYTDDGIIPCSHPAKRGRVDGSGHWGPTHLDRAITDALWAEATND